MTNKSNLNKFADLEMSENVQDQVQGGNYQDQINALQLELVQLNRTYLGNHGFIKKKHRSSFLEKEDVIKCEIDRLTSLDTGGNGDGVW